MHNMTLAPPKISVLMPAYNCEHHISDSIDSILGQTYSDFELLIIDDGSSDSTWKVIQSYNDPRIKASRNTYNIGYLKSTNKLFKASKGKYVTFQDADDWSNNLRLEKQVKAIDSEPELMLCGCYCKTHGEKEHIIKYPKSNKALNLALKIGRTSLFCGASILFDREILKSTGEYREFFNRIGAEDIDWYIRALEKHQAKNLPEVLYHYRQHSKSISAEIKTKKDDLSALSIDIAFYTHKERIQRGTDCIYENPDLREKIEATLKKTKSKIKPITTPKLLSKLAKTTIASAIYRHSRSLRTKRLINESLEAPH